MNKEQLELMQEIWERLPRYQKSDICWGSPDTKWIPGIPNIPILDEGWALEFLKKRLNTSSNQIQLTYDARINNWIHVGIGSSVLSNLNEPDLLTALLKLVLKVMKEEVK